MHSFQLSIWCKADAPSQRLARVLPLFRRRPVHILLRRKTVITLTLRPGSFYTKERSVILLKQPIGIAAANRHVQLSTSGNLEFLLFSVDQFSNLGRFSGQDFEIALLWAQDMRPVFGKFAPIGGEIPKNAARPHSAAHLGESSIATAKRYVWQPMHAMHAYILCTTLLYQSQFWLQRRQLSVL